MNHEEDYGREDGQSSGLDSSSFEKEKNNETLSVFCLERTCDVSYQEDHQSHVNFGIPLFG